MFGLGFPELIVIFLVILLLFGAKALPDIAKGLGKAIQIFKKEAKEIKEELNTDSQQTDSVENEKEDQPSKSDTNNVEA